MARTPESPKESNKNGIMRVKRENFGKEMKLEEVILDIILGYEKTKVDQAGENGDKMAVRIIENGKETILLFSEDENGIKLLVEDNENFMKQYPNGMPISRKEGSLGSVKRIIAAIVRN